jgi:hypothetical protein
MWIVVAVLILTAIWLALGAVLHGGRDAAAEAAGQAWVWEASERSTGLACGGGLPSSHPLARLRESAEAVR